MGEDPTEQYLFWFAVMHVMLDMRAADLIDALPLRKETMVPKKPTWETRFGLNYFGFSVAL